MHGNAPPSPSGVLPTLLFGAASAINLFGSSLRASRLFSTPPTASELKLPPEFFAAFVVPKSRAAVTRAACGDACHRSLDSNRAARLPCPSVDNSMVAAPRKSRFRKHHALACVLQYCTHQENNIGVPNTPLYYAVYM